MPRYVHPAGRECDVALRGREVVIRDAEGERAETHASPADARDAFLAAVRALDEAGYALGVDDDDDDDDEPGLALPSNPALEAAIEEAPGDPAAYLVYGDWLQQQGDPWGTLIALQSGQAHASRSEAFLDHQRQALLGDLAEAFLHGDLKVTWHHGFIAGAIVRATDGATLNTDELLRVLLAHRMARVLQSLELGQSSHSVVQLRTARQARALVALALTGPNHRDELDLTWLPAMAPRLETLELGRVHARLAMGFSNLRRLRAYDAESLDLGPRHAACPTLETVEIAAYDRRRDRTAETLTHQLEMIAVTAPGVSALGLSVQEDTDASDALHRLRASPLAGRISQLTLRFFVPPTLDAIREHLPYLRALQRVRLGGRIALQRNRAAIARELPDALLGRKP